MADGCSLDSFPRILTKTYKNTQKTMVVWLIFCMHREYSTIDLPETIAPIVEELQARDAVLGLILFGSVARNCARPFSDVDLCIVTRKNIPEAVRMDLLSFGSRKIDVSIFSDLPIQIRFRIIKEGRILFFLSLIHI